MKKALMLILALLMVSALKASAEDALWIRNAGFESEEYWTKVEALMAELDVTPENLAEREADWEETWGAVNFWPQEVFLVDFLLSRPQEDVLSPDFTWPVLPREGKPGQKEIADISRRIMHADVDGEVDAEWLDSLSCCAYLWNSVYIFWLDSVMEEPTWLVQFQEFDIDYWSTKYWVFLNEDGEVLFHTLTMESNG